jgi:thiosulfate reductase cytochrome b subunit
MIVERVQIFKRFERFWHWSQAALIITLMLTGFEVHGAHRLFGYGKAVNFHTLAAWSLVSLWAVAVFWHLTTGEWKQYLPTPEKVGAMFRYYLTGIFTNAPHPFRPTAARKLNPLQRLTYLFFWLIIMPLIWFSGWAYLFHAEWGALGLGPYLSLDWVAFFHTIGAFLILVFFIAHIYVATTGHTPLSHIKAMITGWEEVEK